MIDILVNLGFGALVITFVVSIYGAAAAFYGAQTKKPEWVDSAKSAMRLTFPLLTITVVCLVKLLVDHHFEVEYVYSVTSRGMEPYLRVTALWGGQPGSLIFWSWLMAMFATLVTLKDWKRDREFLPWVIVVCLVTLSFFLLLSVFFENPFQRLWEMPNGELAVKMFQPAEAVRLYIPRDGQGLNPLLRHPGMIIHPPMQYLGFVSFVIPYAFAMASLIVGRSDSRWIRLSRRWTLWAWLFLSFGLVLGMRWAYDVLGWGGYWGWDPVEVAALLPWLIATPLLHSIMIQEKRGMFKRWNVILVILTYDIMIYGTFAVRSGVLSSVHAFGKSAIGPILFGFIGLTLITSVRLVALRWDDLKAETRMNSIFSRESFFLINNLLFIVIFLVCFVFMNYPVISEALLNEKKTIGPVMYEGFTGPFWALLVFLMGVCPLTAWRVSTAKSLGRNIWKPTVASLIAPAALVFTGMTNWIAIGVFWFCSLVVTVTVYEFYKGAQARSRKAGTNFIIELGRLIKRNRRRYGGYMIHFGVVLMAVGIIGIEMFQTETQKTIPVGGEITLGDYSITYDNLEQEDIPGVRTTTKAVLSLYKNDEYLGELYPKKDVFITLGRPGQSVTLPGVRRTLEDDFYVILVAWETLSTQQATFKLYRNPLVNWLWIGTFVLLVGTTLAAWPHPEPEEIRQRTRSV